MSDYLKKQKRYYYLEKQKYEQKMYHTLNYVSYKNSSIPSMDGMLLHCRFNPSSRLRAIWGGGGGGGYTCPLVVSLKYSRFTF